MDLRTKERADTGMETIWYTRLNESALGGSAIMRRFALGWGFVCIVLSSGLVGLPVASASADGRPENGSDAPVAPDWPFVGVVDLSGIFVELIDGNMFDLGLRASGCLPQNRGIHLGYSDEYVFFSRLQHAQQTSPWVAGSFVAPWGDAAYPLLTSPAQSWRVLRGSDYPLMMDRFSMEDILASDRASLSSAQWLGTDVQRLASLGHVPAGRHAGGEVLRFKSGLGEQHYLFTNGADVLLEIDGAEAERLLRDTQDAAAEEGDHTVSEETFGLSPTHSPSLARVSDKYVVWSMGTLLWSDFCVLPHAIMQDVQTGSAVSCTVSVLLPIRTVSRSDLRDVPPLRGLDDCAAKSWASVLATGQAGRAVYHTLPSEGTR